MIMFNKSVCLRITASELNRYSKNASTRGRNSCTCVGMSLKWIKTAGLKHRKGPKGKIIILLHEYDNYAKESYHRLLVNSEVLP